MRKFNEIVCAQFTQKFLTSPGVNKNDGMLYLVAQNSIDNNNCGYFVEMIKEQQKNSPKTIKELLGDELLNELNQIQELSFEILAKHWDIKHSNDLVKNGSFNSELYDNYLAMKLKKA